MLVYALVRFIHVSVCISSTLLFILEESMGTWIVSSF